MEPKKQIEEMIAKNKAFLFMKGNPTFPQCGFSNQVVQILKGFDVPFGHFDVLSDPEIRQGIKDYSDWPTIPQFYLDGEFVGGCDIVRESWQSGELLGQLQAAFPDREIKAPEPPAQVQQISPEQAKAMMSEEARFLDVRSPQERAVASIEGFELLDQELAHEMIDSWDRETKLVFICHYGGRSQQAAEFFAERGFRHLNNVSGGIDQWSQTVDDSIPRY